MCVGHIEWERGHVTSDACIPRSTFDPRDVLIPHERSDDGVLAGARADDQDLHALEPTGFFPSPAQTRMRSSGSRVVGVDDAEDVIQNRQAFGDLGFADRGGWDNMHPIEVGEGDQEPLLALGYQFRHRR